MDEEVLELLSAALGVAKAPRVAAPHNVINGAACLTSPGSASPAVASGWINNATLNVVNSCPSHAVQRVARAIVSAHLSGVLDTFTRRLYESQANAAQARRTVLPTRKLQARHTWRASRAVIAKLDGESITALDVLEMVRYQAEREALNNVPVHTVSSGRPDDAVQTVPVGAAALFLARIDTMDWAASIDSRAALTPDPAAKEGPYSTAASLLFSAAEAVLAQSAVMADTESHLKAAALISST